MEEKNWQLQLFNTMLINQDTGGGRKSVLLDSFRYVRSGRIPVLLRCLKIEQTPRYSIQHDPITKTVPQFYTTFFSFAQISLNIVVLFGDVIQCCVPKQVGCSLKSSAKINFKNSFVMCFPRQSICTLGKFDIDPISWSMEGKKAFLFYIRSQTQTKYE